MIKTCAKYGTRFFDKQTDLDLTEHECMGPVLTAAESCIRGVWLDLLDMPNDNGRLIPPAVYYSTISYHTSPILNHFTGSSVVKKKPFCSAYSLPLMVMDVAQINSAGMSQIMDSPGVSTL